MMVDKETFEPAMQAQAPTYAIKAVQQVFRKLGQRQGFELRVYDVRGNSQMHNKFIIIDEQLVVTGSFNWSKAAVNRNRENLLLTGKNTIVKSYVNLFNSLWAKIRPNFRQYF
jgi:phosphatidylserine/phosphatidylglycerophosphate/cardiolipin synthase-like enzyme